MASHAPPSRTRESKATEPIRARPAEAQRPRCLGAAAQLAAIHRTLHGAAIQRRVASGEAAQARTPERTGLPNRLRAGVEALSGLAMDDVRVHRNSAEPERLGALAYTRGSDIHLGPGQERHLPHEAWHVVQQKQGRVRPTTQFRGAAVNADSALEAEADAMAPQVMASQPAAVSTRAAALPTRVRDHRRVSQLQKAPEAEKDEGPSNLAEQLSWKKEYKHSQTLPAKGFDLTLSFAGLATFEHKTVKAAAEALTQAKVKQGETTVGVELNLKAQEIRKLVGALWRNEMADAVLHPEKLSSSISTTAGAYKIETKMTPVPLTIESTVTPLKEIIVELGKGFQAVVSVEFKIKAVRKEEPGLRIQPEPTYKPSPWPAIIAGILALLALIAEYWWVPVLIII